MNCLAIEGLSKARSETGSPVHDECEGVVGHGQRELGERRPKVIDGDEAVALTVKSDEHLLQVDIVTSHLQSNGE